MEPSGGHAAEGREEVREGRVECIHPVERRAAATGGEPPVHGHAHPGEHPDISRKPVGGDDRAPEGASGEAGPACADARFAEAYLLEEHIPMRVHAGHDAHLVPAYATPDPVATAAPGRTGHGKSWLRLWLPDRESGTRVSSTWAGHPVPASNGGSIPSITSRIL